MDEKEIKVRLDLDFRFKDIKGKGESEKIWPAYEMAAEFLVRQASDSKEKRARFFNWGLKLMDQKFIEVSKPDIESIMDALNNTNIANLYFQQLNEVAEKAKDEWDELKKKAKEQKA